MDKKIIRVDLGRVTIKFAILTTGGIVQQKRSIEANILEDGKHIVLLIIESIRHRTDLYNVKREDFMRISVEAPGSVDIEKGTVAGTYNLNWATVQPVKERVESALGVPFALDSDANIATLGKCWKGTKEDNPGAILIILGIGASGGIIATGKLFHGVVGCAGGVGHVMVDPNGSDCTCGKCGCLETVSSATDVIRVVRHLSEEPAGDSELRQAIDSGQDVSSRDAFESAERGDHFVLMVMGRVYSYLGLTTRNLGNTLNLDSVVIGGGASVAEEFLRSRVEKYSQELTFPQVRNSTKIKLAELGNEAGVIGAASLALQFSREK